MEKIKTLQECKDEVAKNKMYTNYLHFWSSNNYEDTINLIEEATELYVSQYKQLNAELLEALKNFVKWADQIDDDGEGKEDWIILIEAKALITKAEQSNLV